MRRTVRGWAAAAWLVASAAWLVKVLLIAENGGSNTDEGVVAVAFLVGVASLVLAGALTGFALLRRFGLWAALLGVPLGAVVVLVGISVVDSLLSAIVPASGWFEDEVGVLGVVVLAALVAVWLGLARSDPRSGRHQPA